jgi:hypothetical protein
MRGFADGGEEERQAPHDPVNHPAHYNAHPSGVECIAVTPNTWVSASATPSNTSGALAKRATPPETLKKPSGTSGERLSASEPEVPCGIKTEK